MAKPDLDVYVRGAGGYAGAQIMEHSNENVNWGFVGDAVLSSWLSETGLEQNIAPDVIFIGDCEGRPETDPDYAGPCKPRWERAIYGTPDAQTGAFVHEAFHAMFKAYHLEDGSNNIMDTWYNWPDTNINYAKTYTLIPTSGYILET